MFCFTDGAERVEMAFRILTIAMKPDEKRGPSDIPTRTKMRLQRKVRPGPKRPPDPGGRTTSVAVGRGYGTGQGFFT